MTNQNFCRNILLLAVIFCYASCKKAVLPEVKAVCISDKTCHASFMQKASSCEATFMDVLFNKDGYETEASVTQPASGGNTLRLFKAKSSSATSPGFFLYILKEYITDSSLFGYPRARVVKFGYIISQEQLTATTSLLKCSIDSKGKTFVYSKGVFESTGHTGFAGRSKRIAAHYKGKKYYLNEPLSIALDAGKTIFVNCVSWYLETYNIETGEIISETYLFTTCDEVQVDTGDGGGGGSGNGDNNGTTTDEDDGVLASAPVEWTVSEVPGRWELRSTEQVDGIKKTSEINGGHFTSIKHNKVYFFTGGDSWEWEYIYTIPSVENKWNVKMYVKGWIKAKISPSGYKEPAENFKTWFFKDIF
jgi:hypothetical protein